MTNLLTQSVVAFDNIAPVILARVLYQHEDLADLPQFSERLDGLRGQRRDAENHNARRQAKGPAALGHTLFRLCFQGHDEPVMNTRTRGLGQRLADIAANISPELRLPKVLIIQRSGNATVVGQDIAPSRPTGQPVCAITLVTIKDVGHLRRELVQLAPIGATLAQVTTQGRIHRVGFSQ